MGLVRSFDQPLFSFYVLRVYPTSNAGDAAMASFENPYLLLATKLVPMESDVPVPKELRQVGLKVRACEYFPSGRSGDEEELLLLISEPQLLNVVDYLHKEARELLGE